MPWPVRWMNCSPYPAVGDHVAGRRVDRLGGHPGPDVRRRPRAGPRAAPRSTRRTRPAARRGRTCGCSPSSSPRRVVPPMSTTTASPLSITRSPTSWCGRAPFGPEPTMTKSTVLVALGEDRGGDVAADLALGAAGPQALGHPGVHPVDGLAGPAQRVDLVGGLAHPQLAEHRGRRGSARRRAGRPATAAPARPTSGWPAPTRRGAAQPAGDHGVRVVGLAPADHLDVEVAHRRRQRRRAPRARAPPGTGRPSAGSTRQVSRSSGSAS